jgi:hypothetical protein
VKDLPAGRSSALLPSYRILFPVVAFFYSLGCSENVPTGVRGLPTNVHWSRNAIEIGRSGCAFILTTPKGSVRELYVPRVELPFILPQVDSLQANTSGDQRGVLVVANADYTTTNGAGLRQSVVIACLVPAGFSSQSLAQRVATARNAEPWSKLEGLLQGSAIAEVTSQTPIRTAAVMLWANFTNSSWKRNVNFLPGSASLPAPRQFQPHAFLADSASCGPTVGWACTTPVLDPVVVTSRVGWDANAWIFDFSELEWASRNGYSIGATSSEIYNGSGTCASANDFYYAMDETISRKEADANAMEQAYNDAANTATLTCVIRDDSLSTAHYTVCIDNWISGKRAFIFGGDNRGPDSTAGYTASRFQEYIDPVACKAYWVQNVSSIQVPFYHDTTASPSQHEAKDLTLTCNADTGVIDVHMEVYDAYCTFPGARAICPSIDADVRLTPLSDGSYDVKWIKDGYPSIAVYQANTGNTEFHTLRRDSGNTEPLGWLQLITYRNEVNRLRQALHLPPGCYFQ